MISLILYTKSKCHLCEVMKELVLRLKNEYNFVFEVIDIENKPDLFEKYKDKIPVLMIDGKLFAKYKVDENKLKKKLIRQGIKH